MTITLAKDVEDFLEEQIRSGVCADAGEFVNDMVRSLRQNQVRPFKATPELETWLLEAAGQPTSPLTNGDFEAMRKRASARAAAKTK